MNNWRRRLALGLAFILTSRAFAWATDGLPYTPLFWLIYYGGAATVDLIMYKLIHLFISSRLQRDIEALCIASVAVNALGWALLQMADAPPDFYNYLIAGLNYALAIRILIGDGYAFDRFDRTYWRGMVRRAFLGNQNRTATEKKS